MTTIERSTQTRILCKETGRLIATTNEFGATIWCKYAKKPEFIPWEQWLAAYEKAKGQSVQCNGEGNETASTTVA